MSADKAICLSSDPEKQRCIRCGKDALDTGWECTECGYDEHHLDAALAAAFRPNVVFAVEVDGDDRITIRRVDPEEGVES